MSGATLTHLAPLVRPSERTVERTRARLVDAVSAYDAALDRGAPMLVLVRLDQEVATATRRHHEAVDVR